MAFLMLIVFLQLTLSSCDKAFWPSSYGVNTKSKVVEKITHENKHYIKTVNFLTDDAVELSKQNPVQVISFHRKRVNSEMISIFKCRYDIESSGLVTNRNGETRLIKDVSRTNKGIEKRSISLIIFYFSMIMLLFHYFRNYGNLAIVFWLSTIVISAYLIHIFMPGNIIMMVWFIGMFIIALGCEFASKVGIIYEKHFHWFSFGIIVITGLILLFKVYQLTLFA